MSTKITRFHRVLFLGFNFIIIISLILVAGVGFVQASHNPITPANVPIDPSVYIALEQIGNAQILVVLKEQADLSAASSLTSKADKGTYVYHQLTEVANRTQGPMQSFLESTGAEYRAYWIQNMFMVTVNTQLLGDISKQPGVARIELYHQPYPDRVGADLGPDYGPEFGPLPIAIESNASSMGEGNLGKENGPFPTGNPDAVEWNITRVKAPDVWALGINGAGAVIGDLDTGVQWDHPALINSYRGWNGVETDHNYNWWDGVAGSKVPTDYDTHGTHTMGTIVGDDGGANQIGMAPGAKWMACPGVGSPNVGTFECFQFFVAPTDLNGENPRPDLAPHVISNSWSSAGTDYHSVIQALYAAGIFYSKSAGNTGSSCSTITNPGQWSEVTAAAAFAQGDAIASFSSRGPVYFGHDVVVKPDIAAPGVNVRSSMPGNGYQLMSGTSMACPHVTGAVALLISANPELAGRIDILQMLLKQNAEPKISAQCQPFVDHPNDVWGWGILNIYNSVVAAQGVQIGSIQGTVTDATTLEPVPNVTLTFRDSTNSWNFTGMSDANGYYLLDLPASTYDVTANHYGYQDAVVENVEVIEGTTVTQDIALIPASIWMVSGAVTELGTGNPLASLVVFDKTPMFAQTDPETGVYTANVAQGTWWMDVTSPGHKSGSRQVTVDQNLTEDFSLEAIQNYYMHRSVDGACGATFNWMDAVNGGVPHPLSDDSSVFVSFTGGESFTFYGATYNGVFVGSNGIATFGTGSSSASGPIPNPALPNNGIYAFSMDLDPMNGNQGNIYTKYIDNRFFVIEWYQVQHYPNGNPESFEIVLDFDTNQVTIQYLTVSDPTSAVSGVENSTGTEATQYAYSDPNLIANDVAVTFYPQFGTPPPTGGAGELTGLVSDAESGNPIQDATVFAEAYSGGEVFTFTTNVNGVYSAPLCADWYNTSAEAVGYNPVLDVNVSVVSATQTVQDFALSPICEACTGVDFSWIPNSPIQGDNVTFTGVASGTLPIIYAWDFGDGEFGSAQIVDHAFIDAGTFTVTLSVDNCAGVPLIKEYAVTVLPSIKKIFLPLTLQR